jgi:hypothetical protein
MPTGTVRYLETVLMLPVSPGLGTPWNDGLDAPPRWSRLIQASPDDPTALTADFRGVTSGLGLPAFNARSITLRFLRQG